MKTKVTLSPGAVVLVPHGVRVSRVAAPVVGPAAVVIRGARSLVYAERERKPKPAKIKRGRKAKRGPKPGKPGTIGAAILRVLGANGASGLKVAEVIKGVNKMDPTLATVDGSINSALSRLVKNGLVRRDLVGRGRDLYRLV